MDAGLFLLRGVVGLLLAGHGARKLFGWFGGGGLCGTAWYFRSVGYHPPRMFVALAGGAELAAGIALTAGFMTPLAAGMVIGTMLNAIAVVHWRNGLWAIDNGGEYPLMIATAAATLAFTGPGAVSVDAWLGIGAGATWGISAVVLGLVAGSAVLVHRAVHRSPAGRTAEWLRRGEAAA
jgi:putative oxidoreductase